MFAIGGRVERPQCKAQARVLVTDDEPQVRDLAVETLADAGFEVVSAESGDDALRKLKADRTIGLLLTDIRMPGMDGWTLARAAKAVRPDLRVVYMTGYAILPPENLGVGLGPVLPKPWRISEFLGVIRSMIGHAADGA